MLKNFISDEAHTLGSLFHSLDLSPLPGSLTVKEVFLSETGRPSNIWTVTELTHTLSHIWSFFVNVVTPSAASSPPNTENAFDRLMAGPCQTWTRKAEATAAMAERFFQSWFHSKSHCWEHSLRGMISYSKTNTMLRVLTDALWKIDEHHEETNH